MSTQRTYREPARPARTRYPIGKPIGVAIDSILVFVVALACAAAASALVAVPEDELYLYAWEPSVLEPEDRLRISGSSVPRCSDVVPGSICAEFRNDVTGFNAGTCCIAVGAVGTSNLNACIAEATVERDPQPDE